MPDRREGRVTRGSDPSRDRTLASGDVASRLPSGETGLHRTAHSGRDWSRSHGFPGRDRIGV